MQSGNHGTYIRKYNHMILFHIMKKIKQDILTKLKGN